jgi:dihydrofolate reductase
LEAKSLLLGRVTYEGFSAAWPERDREFADEVNAMAEGVVTSTVGVLDWNATALTGDVPRAVARLEGGAGGPILVAGSAMLVRTLLVHGLVNELRLKVLSVMVSGGLTIFPGNSQKVELELQDLTRFASGVVLEVSRPA